VSAICNLVTDQVHTVVRYHLINVPKFSKLSQTVKEWLSEHVLFVVYFV